MESLTKPYSQLTDKELFDIHFKAHGISSTTGTIYRLGEATMIITIDSSRYTSFLWDEGPVFTYKNNIQC